MYRMSKTKIRLYYVVLAAAVIVWAMTVLSMCMVEQLIAAVFLGLIVGFAKFVDIDATVNANERYEKGKAFDVKLAKKRALITVVITLLVFTGFANNMSSSYDMYYVKSLVSEDELNAMKDELWKIEGCDFVYDNIMETDNGKKIVAITSVINSAVAFKKGECETIKYLPKYNGEDSVLKDLQDVYSNIIYGDLSTSVSNGVIVENGFVERLESDKARILATVMNELTVSIMQYSICCSVLMYTIAASVEVLALEKREKIKKNAKSAVKELQESEK